MTRYALRLLSSLVLVSVSVLPAAAARPDSSIFGNLSIRYWLANDILGVNQTAGTQQASELRTFDYGMVEVDSSYWFGTVRQEQLLNLGALFGVGFSFGFGGFSLTVPNTDPVTVNTHYLNFDLLKFRILGDPEGPANLIATANYTNFANGAVQLSNFAGLGLGLEGKKDLGPWGDLYFKSMIIPFPITAGTSGLAALEIGSRWVVAPNVRLNLAYKGLFAGLSVDQTATPTGSTTPTTVHMTLWDVFHGPEFGTTFTF